MYQASGAAFLELDNLPATRDHFYQAVGDLSTLKRSLEVGNWKSAIGYELDPNISYVGQSLGGIIGGVFAAVQPSLQRVVLNVPGGNLVDIFRESGHFKSHFSQFIRAHDIIPGTEDYDKLLLAARWLVDVIDPINYARYLQSESFEPTFDFGPRSVMIQKAKGDFIIPNFTTEKLAKVGDIKMFDYSGTHAFIVVPIEPAYYSGLRDIGKFIKRGVFPDEDE